MKRMILNTVSVLTIGFGGLYLAAPVNAMGDGECDAEGGWQLQCDGDRCCTVCQDGGSIGDCQ